MTAWQNIQNIKPAIYGHKKIKKHTEERIKESFKGSEYQVTTSSCNHKKALDW